MNRLHNLIDRAEALLLERGIRATRLELTEADQKELGLDLKLRHGNPFYTGSMFGGVYRGLNVAPAITDQSALCWRRPGKIGRYEIVPWQRCALIHKDSPPMEGRGLETHSAWVDEAGDLPCVPVR
jgi:hypothetical protein